MSAWLRAWLTRPLGERFYPRVQAFTEEFEEAPEKDGDDGRVGVGVEGWEGGKDKAENDKTVAPKTREGPSGLGPFWATGAMDVLHGLCQQRAPRAFASMGSPGRPNRRGQL